MQILESDAHGLESRLTRCVLWAQMLNLSGPTAFSVRHGTQVPSASQGLSCGEGTGGRAGCIRATPIANPHYPGADAARAGPPLVHGPSRESRAQRGRSLLSAWGWRGGLELHVGLKAGEDHQCTQLGGRTWRRRPMSTNCRNRAVGSGQGVGEDTRPKSVRDLYLAPGGGPGAAEPEHLDAPGFP